MVFIQVVNLWKLKHPIVSACFEEHLRLANLGYEEHLILFSSLPRLFPLPRIRGTDCD
jgi:hypothetical protein